MSKQMYEIDDQDAGEGASWQRKSPQEESCSDFSLSYEERKRSSQAFSSSGKEDAGMGKQNPFENWRIKKDIEEKPLSQAKSFVDSFKAELSLLWKVLSGVVISGLVAASLFSLWTPGSFIPKTIEEKVAVAVAQEEGIEIPEIIEGVKPADFPTNRIGIVVGHRGYDSGAVCANGLTELEINSNVATYVQQKLIKQGYEVDLLDEYDARLKNYQAQLLLSIHSDSCDYINDGATGFKVASAITSNADPNASRLVQCLSDRYAKTTGLRYHYQSVTTDMTSYHAFDEISPFTTAAIIELGFMNLDQEILRTQPELLADGIVAGIGCYLNNEKLD